MLRPLLLILLAWLFAGIAGAQTLLVAETRTVAAGGRIEVTLFLPNDSGEEKDFDLPPRLTLRPLGAAEGTTVALEPLEPALRVRLAPGRFHRARYAGVLPVELTGEVVLQPVDFPGTPIIVTATMAATTTAAAPAGAAGSAAGDAGKPDPDAARFATAFSPYEPNYFSIGDRGETNARFQVSMKFRLFNPNTKTPFLEKLYIGYSQTSIWDLSATSKPFHDSSYRPSLFFQDDAVSQWPSQRVLLGFQGGFEHESNGKDGVDSRSINIAYVKPTFTYPFAASYFVSFAPKIYRYIDRDDNPDIADYRGYADYVLKVGETDGLQLASTLRKGTRSGVYSALLDLSYPLRRPTLGNLGGYLHLQYFSGYGESLLDYKQRLPPQFRVGLMITR